MQYISNFCFIAVTIASVANAQHPLPENDNDWVESNEKIFLKDEVTEVYITLDEDDLDSIIGNTDSNDLKNCTVRFVNSVVDETFSSVGIRARGNSQRDATKFPWKLDFNEWVEDRKVFGLEKMNFNSESVDPTISRATLALDLFRSMGVAASRSSHIWLTINDGSKVQGIYNNVEQIDEEFMQAWFGNNDGDTYKCRLKDDGATLTKLQPNVPETYEASEDYEEQRTGSFLRLYDFINFIEDSDDITFRRDIKDYLNVDSFLRAQAVDVSMGGWDGLYMVANNYYLYYDEETAVFEYIPWDLDHTFGMDYIFIPTIFGTNFATKRIEDFGDGCFIACNPGENGPPLIDRMLKIPEYAQMLEKYVKEITSTYMHPAVLGTRAYELKDLLVDLVYSGTFSGPTMDNGYNKQDFIKGFVQPNSYQKFAGATWGILPFIRTREEFIRDNYDMDNSFVVINEVLADNENGIVDENDQNEDWVELYNESDEEVDLSGFFLTDRYGNPRQWEIPEGTIIGPRDYLLIWCDDDEDEGPLHTNFKLGKNGEGVYLYANHPDLNLLVSSIVYPALSEDQSFGRLSDGSSALGIFDDPTPLSANKPDEFVIFNDGLPPGEFDLGFAGATPDSTISFFWSSFVPTEFTIPDPFPCGGTTIDLLPNPDKVIQIGTENGAAIITIPEDLLDNVYMQAIDMTTCETSNVLDMSE